MAFYNIKIILFVILCTYLVQCTQAQEYDFTGRYRMYSSENFDEFLKALGINYFRRIAANKMTPEYIITKNGDSYTLRTVTAFTESAITFRSGVEFKESRMDGLYVRTVINVKDNIWTQVQYSDPEVNIVREFSPTEVKVTSVCQGVTSLRKYKKV